MDGQKDEPVLVMVWVKRHNVLEKNLEIMINERKGSDWYLLTSQIAVLSGGQWA